MKYKVSLGNLIGATITMIVFAGGIWVGGKIANMEISILGLSPRATGYIWIIFFLVIFLTLLFKISDKWLDWVSKVKKENKDGSFLTKKN